MLIDDTTPPTYKDFPQYIVVLLNIEGNLSCRLTLQLSPVSITHWN